MPARPKAEERTFAPPRAKTQPFIDPGVIDCSGLPTDSLRQTLLKEAQRARPLRVLDVRGAELPAGELIDLMRPFLERGVTQRLRLSHTKLADEGAFLLAKRIITHAVKKRARNASWSKDDEARPLHWEQLEAKGVVIPSSIELIHCNLTTRGALAVIAATRAEARVQGNAIDPRLLFASLHYLKLSASVARGSYDGQAAVTAADDADPLSLAKEVRAEILASLDAELRPAAAGLLQIAEGTDGRLDAVYNRSRLLALRRAMLENGELGRPSCIAGLTARVLSADERERHGVASPEGSQTVPSEATLETPPRLPEMSAPKMRPGARSAEEELLATGLPPARDGPAGPLSGFAAVEKTHANSATPTASTNATPVRNVSEQHAPKRAEDGPSDRLAFLNDDLSYDQLRSLEVVEEPTAEEQMIGGDLLAELEQTRASESAWQSPASDARFRGSQADPRVDATPQRGAPVSGFGSIGRTVPTLPWAETDRTGEGSARDASTRYGSQTERLDATHSNFERSFDASPHAPPRFGASAHVPGGYEHAYQASPPYHSPAERGAFYDAARDRPAAASVARSDASLAASPVARAAFDAARDAGAPFEDAFAHRASGPQESPALPGFSPEAHAATWPHAERSAANANAYAYPRGLGTLAMHGPSPSEVAGDDRHASRYYASLRTRGAQVLERMRVDYSSHVEDPLMAILSNEDMMLAGHPQRMARSYDEFRRDPPEMPLNPSAQPMGRPTGPPNADELRAALSQLGLDRYLGALLAARLDSLAAVAHAEVYALFNLGIPQTEAKHLKRWAQRATGRFAGSESAPRSPEGIPPRWPEETPPKAVRSATTDKVPGGYPPHASPPAASATWPAQW